MCFSQFHQRASFAYIFIYGYNFLLSVPILAIAYLWKVLSHKIANLYVVIKYF